MATDQSFVDYLCEQAGLGVHLSYRKMFGEYALYLDEKVVAFVCDNLLYLKPTEQGRAALGTVSEHPPYPGAKLYFRLGDELDNRHLLQRVLKVTPTPCPGPNRNSRPSRRRPRDAQKSPGRHHRSRACGPSGQLITVVR